MNISPRIDFAFKKIFGSEENKDLLISLINAILQLADPIIEITLKNPYNLADYLAGKMSILDIKAKDQAERWFNVEMQINQDLHYDKRALYYWCKLVTEQIKEGEMYNKLNKTFSINLLSFDFFTEATNFHNRYRILNVETCKDDGKHFPLEIHYLELRKFNKPFNELTTALDRWITFLNRAHDLDKLNLPATLAQDQDITKALQVTERLFNETERNLYEIRWQTIVDEANRVDSARKEGREEGRQEGRQEGKIAGEVKGKAELLKRQLTRLGAELVFAICEAKNVEVVIINQGEDATFEEDLAKDVLEIITVFSARLYGSRSHKNKKLLDGVKNAIKEAESC